LSFRIVPAICMRSGVPRERLGKLDRLIDGDIGRYWRHKRVDHRLDHGRAGRAQRLVEDIAALGRVLDR
jgi:hypothetical protein